MPWTVESLAKRLQHTLVAPDATEAQVRALCRDCAAHGFDGAMVQPCWVGLAREALAGSGVKVCTAFGYPMGGDTPQTKAAAMRACVAAGADEVDFMPNLGWLKSGHDERVRDELRRIVEAAEGRVTKAMLELGMLTPEEGRRAAGLAVEAGVGYAKNSNGVGEGDQGDVAVVRELRGWVGQRARVKASGGVKAFDQAVALLEAGADLIGTSSAVAIVAGGPGGDY